ncbi:hypothetical protein HDU98_001916 [Podochytrium sp. JEL0797]|nr:hypothetical protein HDU98_001916 [Podochytrium sp. JEL0797]
MDTIKKQPIDHFHPGVARDQKNHTQNNSALGNLGTLPVKEGRTSPDLYPGVAREQMNQGH